MRKQLTIPINCVKLFKSHGEVSEWFKELVLKTSDAKAPRVRISASPPLLFKDRLIFYLRLIAHSAGINLYMEKYSRGRRGAPAKGVGRATGARVQISPSPPENKYTVQCIYFLHIIGKK